jgi:serine protein kinase
MTLSATLQDARRALLDLSTRNRLLALPATARARGVLRIEGERAAFVVERLAAGRAFGFEATEASQARGRRKSEGVRAATAASTAEEWQGDDHLRVAQPPEDLADAKSAREKQALLADPRRCLALKLKLYDGRMLPGYTQDTVKELRKDTKREGMDGISPRFVQDMLSNALVRYEEPTLNPFMVMNEIERGLKAHSLITADDQRKRYTELIGVVRREYEDIIKNEVQRAISADETEIQKLAANYVDNVRAHTLKEKLKNRYTGRDEEPDERLMRSIEEKIEIAEPRKDDFRREIMNFIGALALEGKKFTWNTNDRLRRALELKLFEDKKDTIKFTSIVSNVLDRETQEKIDAVKTRLMRDFGYDEISAQNVLEYVSSIFARGDVKA